MTVKLEHSALKSAIDAYQSLADAINYHRGWCTRDCPIELPSLAEGTSLTQVRDWLIDQKAVIQPVYDLAFLLDTEGSGPIEVPGTGALEELREQLGTELAQQLADAGEIDNPDDLAAFEAKLAILERHQDDIVVSGAFHTELGPEGLDTLMSQIGFLNNGMSNYSNSVNNPEYLDENGAPPDVWTAAQTLQDRFASVMASSLASGSSWKDFPESYAEDFANMSDGTTQSIIFDYAAKNGDVFGRDFLVDVGSAMVERDQKEGGQWGALHRSAPWTFGTADTDQLRDPMTQYMEALSLNGVASQDMLLDPNQAAYLLERHYYYEDPPGNAAGDVLASATVDLALQDNYMGENAAKISSWAIEHFGGGADPQDGIKEELGGIVATYIRDVGYVALDPGSDNAAGIYGPGDEPAGIFEGEGFPPYGLTINRDDLSNMLEDIGDNDTAISLIGDANGRFTQARLNDAINTVVSGGHLDPSEVGTDDPYYSATYTNSAITGYLYDGLYDGSIDDAKEDAAKRAKLWNLLMVPTQYVDVPGGPVGSFVVGEVKDKLKEEFVGDGVSDATSAANNGYENVQQSTIMQSLYTLVANDNAADFPMGDLREDWPTFAPGVPIPPDMLTSEQRTAIINSVNSPNSSNGYGAAAYQAGLAGTDTLMQQYGDN